MNRSFSDGLRFISRITTRRFINAAGVLCSYYFARITGKAIHRGLPISISIEPTTSCNLRCPECPSGLRSFTRPTGMLNTELYRKAIDELAPSLWYLILYFQGEPFLHPDFFNLVKYAAAKNIYTATSTNGHYLSESNADKIVQSGLDRLIISIDGTTQETYESYRIGGKLEKVIEGTKRVVEAKKRLKSKTPHIIFQFLVVKHNEHQITEVKKLAAQLGVNETGFKTAQVYDYENGNELIPDNTKYSRYKKNGDGTYSVKNNYENNCWKLWHSAVITWDGTVVPCCFDKDAQNKMGSLTDTSFSDIWNNNLYRNFRESVVRSRKEIEMCKNCTEGTTIWAG
ncbi:MAG: radical SAM/SPASM domain-containing protein [Bacteroidota bacterium]